MIVIPMEWADFISFEEKVFPLLPIYFILPLSALVIYLLFLLGSPYGKHDGSWLGFSINAKVIIMTYENIN